MMQLSSFSYRKVYGYVAIILMILTMSWEFQKVDAALHMSSIPEESIRLRILANSDAPDDQFIKAIVRDVVVASMSSWITEPVSIDEARNILIKHEVELQSDIAATLMKYGFDYSFDTTIGLVDFPTKMYGNQIYPAGEYEALLITLGKGEGRNWWCVLFPPLCFTDAVAGEATTTNQVATVSTTIEEGNSSDLTRNFDHEEVEVHLFIVEWFEDIGNWIGSLFA